jgi:lantibiotic modifying enzyme
VGQTVEGKNLYNGGWGVALFIIALAVVTNLAVFSIHKTTYLAPPDHPPGAASTDAGH